MLRRIKSLKNFGIFKDFSWGDNTQDFNKNNLIYGWNYSGKTTLSNLFRVLEKKRIDEEYGSPTFELELDDGSKITAQDIESHNLDIRVFNKEYVEENFGLFEGSSRVGPIYIALEEDKTKKEEIDKKEGEVSNLQTELETKNKEIENKDQALRRQEKEFDKRKIDIAEVIRRELKLNQSEFTKKHLVLRLQEEKPPPLDEESIEKNLTNYKQTAQEKIDFTEPDGIDIPKETVRSLKDLLSQEVQLGQNIPELEAYPERREWVQQGLHLHEDIDKCSFCDNTITEQRKEKLESFFAEAYSAMQKRVNDCEEYLNEVVRKVGDVQFPAKNDFIESKRADFEKLNCEQIKTSYLEEIKVVLLLVQEKKGDITKEVATDSLKEEYIFNLNDLRSLIRENNEAIKNISNIKDTAKETLIVHFVEEKRDEIEEMEGDIKAEKILKRLSEIQEEDIKKKIKKVEIAIKQLEKLASSVDAALDQVNGHIQEFLGHNELTLEKVNEGDDVGGGEKFVFALNRRGRPATKLSEGEKTIISFAYFFTKLGSVETAEGASNAAMKDTIVFIDDPISSFDDQHLSYMASFIRNNLVKECGQLFISTHNFTFFDQLRTFKAYRQDSSSRIDNKFFIEVHKESASTDERTAKLVNLPELIDNFKSEYNYMFKLIYEFSMEQNPSEYNLFPSIPNAFRNFLETYVGIQYPTGDGLKKQLEKFIFKGEEVDHVLITQVMAVVNRGSHSDGANSTRPQISDPQELQNTIQKVLKCIETKTKEHFGCLKTSVTGDNSSAQQTENQM